MIKIELRTEYTAQEIRAIDFDYLGNVPPDTHVPGVVYRPETRTARLMTEQELEDMRDEVLGETNDDDAEDLDTIARKRREKSAHSYAGRAKGTGGHPGPHSFHGIGCFIICKNGKPVDIISPEKLKEVYKFA